MKKESVSNFITEDNSDNDSCDANSDHNTKLEDIEMQLEEELYKSIPQICKYNKRKSFHDSTSNVRYILNDNEERNTTHPIGKYFCLLLVSLMIGGEGVGQKSVTCAKNLESLFWVLKYKGQSRQTDHDVSMMKSGAMVKVPGFCFSMDFDRTTSQLKHYM